MRRDLGLGIWRGGRRGNLLGREDGWDQIGTRVGGDVEHRVDSIGQHGERVLGHEQPDQSEDYPTGVSFDEPDDDDEEEGGEGGGYEWGDLRKY